MDKHIIYSLIQKYKKETATKEERKALLEWYRKRAYKDAIYPGDEEIVKEEILRSLIKDIKPKMWARTINRRLAIAASIVLILSFFVLIIARNKLILKSQVQIAENDIAPGGDKAILTLGNGMKISLTDAVKGDMIAQPGVNITKTSDGQVVYALSEDSKMTDAVNEPSYNTIQVPAGGQFQIILPDKTHVWLNSLSSLTFPSSFSSGTERRVELKGEAYFEVAHNKLLPFRVITGRQSVKVLGTHFNISAYSDEKDIKTTLLEGSVLVTADDQKIQLKPSEQAKLRDGNKLEVLKVNTENIVAWKDGYFKFDDERLEDIMRKVSRWYNVSIIYDEENMKDETFGVLSTRFSNISTLLKLMEQTGDLNFSLNRSEIHISKKKLTK